MMERFWSKVRKDGAMPRPCAVEEHPEIEGIACWEWIAAKEKGGYGSFTNEGRSYRAHRFSWQLHNGPIPERMYVLHKCDNPSCVNPFHLFLGTSIDNTNNMKTKDRGNGWRGRKEYIISFPDGHEEIVSNLSEFCRDHGLSQGSMSNVAVGRLSQFRGFRARYRSLTD